MSLTRWGWGSIALNVALAASHATVAIVSGSLAVTAELVHNVVDLLSAVAVLVGLKLATRTSRMFPYGLYKIENLIAAGLAGLIFLTAYELVRGALASAPRTQQTDPWMLVLVTATTIAPLVFSRYEMRAAREGNSPALIADAREYRVHVATTGLVFASLATNWVGLPVDRIATIAIVAVVAKTGWDLFLDAIRVLLDASLDPATVQRIRQTIDADPAVTTTTWITARNAGRFRFVEAGITLRPTHAEAVTAAVRRIEATVQAAVPIVDRVLIHPEPAGRAGVRYGVPLDDPVGTISEHFGSARYLALVTVDPDGSVREQQVHANPHVDASRAKGILVAEWMAAHKADVVLTRETLEGPGPSHVLGEAGIALRTVNVQDLATAIRAQPLPPGPPSAPTAPQPPTGTQPP